MLAEYKTKTNVGILVGIILPIIGRTILDESMLGVIVTLVGTVFFIWGCMCYAQGKGYHFAYGFLGLLSIVGLIILFFLPDQHKQ